MNPKRTTRRLSEPFKSREAILRLSGEFVNVSCVIDEAFSFLTILIDMIACLYKVKDSRHASLLAF